jgi:hypothetical protein
MSTRDDEETCIVASFESAEQAARVRSGLPAAWNAEVEGTDVIVVAKDDAHATEIESALQTASTERQPANDAGADIAGGVIDAAAKLLDYL